MVTLIAYPGRRFESLFATFSESSVDFELDDRLAEGRDVSGYDVDVKPTGDDALDPLVTASSLLISLQKAKYPGDFAFIARLRSDYRNIGEALQSRGYYDGQVIITMTLAGKAPIDAKDPHLLDYLRQRVRKVSVISRFQSSKATFLKSGRSRFTFPSLLKRVRRRRQRDRRRRASLGVGPSPCRKLRRESFGLKSGQPAIAEDVLAALGRLLHDLLETGHAEARVDAPIAMVDKSAKTLNLKLTVYEGPVVAIGPVTFSGMKRTRLSFLKNRLQLHEGELYRPSKLRPRVRISSIRVSSPMSG